jgi:hypothetical protein
MKYMLLCYHDEQDSHSVEQAAMQRAMDESVRLMHEIHAKGQYLASAPLHPIATATCVRMRDGKRLVIDGPFVETREVLGGFYLIDVPDLDEAIAIAARTPGARFGTIEIRPVMEMPGLPTGLTSGTVEHSTERPRC